jgi:hypothetical protein
MPEERRSGRPACEDLIKPTTSADNHQTHIKVIGGGAIIDKLAPSKP